MVAPHLRHFILTVLPCTLSSETVYFALQEWQVIFIGGQGSLGDCPGGRRLSAGRDKRIGHLHRSFERWLSCKKNTNNIQSDARTRASVYVTDKKARPHWVPWISRISMV